MASYSHRISKLKVSLKNIKQALSFLPTHTAPTKSDWQRLSKQWNHELNQKIKELEVLRDNLSSCIGCGCLSLKACPLYNPEDQLGADQSGAVLLKEKAKID